MALITPIGCADDLTPKVCTSNLIPSETSDGACYQVTINGADDVTIIQGADFDPTDGVVAYDGHGDEIDFSYSPSEIAECEVGKQTIRYSATGYGTRIRPHFPCVKKNKLHISEDCGNDTDTAVVYRTITVEQADPPTISGIDDITIQPNTDFNALSGVSAVDAHGNTVDVEYSGSYDLEATGNPAEFSADESTGIKSLSVALEPIQDLNGYSKPWVGGAGKNLLPLTVDGIKSLSTAGTWNGNSYTHAGITFTLVTDSGGNITQIRASGTATAQATLTIAQFSSSSGVSYVLNGCPSGGGASTYRIGWGYHGYDSGSGLSSAGANDTRNVAVEVYSGYVANNVVFYPMIRLASVSDATFEPYENICPISGRSAVETHRTGRNLLETNDALSWTPSLTKNTDGSIHVVGIRTSNGAYAIGSVDLKADTAYTLRKSGSSDLYFQMLVDGTAVTTAGTNDGTYTPTTDVTATIRLFARANITYDTVLYPQLELGSTASTYEPYLGTTYDTTLGRTVYGGTLDIVSGVLTVDRAMVDLGTLNWTERASGTSQWIANMPSASITPKSGGDTDSLCDSYAMRATGLPSNGEYILNSTSLSTSSKICCICDTSYTSASAFKTAVTGKTLVYSLATPTTYQLTPQEVEALVGENVVWSDGDVTVVYSHEIPQGTFQYPVDGEYRITYTASDKCGNTRTRTRKITVGTFRTVLYKDKTLIINEASWDTAGNIRAHGTATNVYPAFDPNGSTDVAKYIFADRTDQPWFAKREDILTVIIGSPIKPTSTAYWFTNFTTCEEIDVSLLDTSRVTNMAFMFAQCPSLTFLDIYHFDTSKVTNMSGMFNYCRDIESLDITNFDTSNVTDMSHMFAECRTLTELNLSTFATYDVTDMTSMFYLDDALTTIYATGAFSVSGVSASDNMFYRCDVIEGGNGTVYDEEYIDKTYARIDGDEPGYFTDSSMLEG